MWPGKGRLCAVSLGPWSSRGPAVPLGRTRALGACGCPARCACSQEHTLAIRAQAGRHVSSPGGSRGSGADSPTAWKKQLFPSTGAMALRHGLVPAWAGMFPGCRGLRNLLSFAESPVPAAGRWELCRGQRRLSPLTPAACWALSRGTAGGAASQALAGAYCGRMYGQGRRLGPQPLLLQ